jgi:Rieske Fe-S protein
MSIPDTGRRRFLSFCTTMLMTIIGLAVAVPAVAYLLGPLRKKRGTAGGGAFIDVGPVAVLPVGQWSLRPLVVEEVDGWKRREVNHSVWVRRQGEGDREIAVLSSICPHLGCPVNWYASEEKFKCPCHGGTFSGNGSHEAGPPPRSMDKLDFEVRAGNLWVRWQDFKIGVAERIPISG